MGFFRPAGDAVLITAAQQSRQAEMKQRQRRYSYTMGFRTISFVVAVVLPIPVWAKFLLIGGSIVLPWTAVTAANAGPRRQKVAKAYDPGAEQVGAAPLRLTASPGWDPSSVVPGTVINGETDRADATTG